MPIKFPSRRTTLFRSDIRTDPATAAPRAGIPLTLTINV
jgi:hypothetical protein